MKDMKKSKIQGFMLLELITVIFIISALVLIFVPNFRWSVEKAQFTSCQGNIKNLTTAIQSYSIDNEDLYPENLEKVTPEYIKYIPTCPSAGTQTYMDGYEVEDDNKLYSVNCYGKNHSSVGAGENEPYFNLEEGLKP